MQSSWICVTGISRSSVGSYWSYGRRNLHWDLFQEMLEIWQRSVHANRLYPQLLQPSIISTHSMLFFFLSVGHPFIHVPTQLKATENWITTFDFQRPQSPVNVLCVNVSPQASSVDLLIMCNVIMYTQYNKKKIMLLSVYWVSDIFKTKRGSSLLLCFF